MKSRDILQQKLVTIGLTPQEADIYVLVLRNSKIKVKEIADQLKIMVSGVHRTLHSLRIKGCVLTSGKRPITLTAVPPSMCLSKLVNEDYQKRIVIQKQIEEEVNRQTTGREELDVQFLESKQETYNYVLPIIQKLKKELFILSVGEPVPDEIFVAIVEAIRRGITVKMLAETYNESNRELLQNWQKNGYEVRYLPKQSPDFTLTIHDGKSCVVQIRREKEKEQRVGIAISNPGYTQAQRQYFLSLWAKAKPIE